jgi:hypothetical protein
MRDSQQEHQGNRIGAHVSRSQFNLTADRVAGPASTARPKSAAKRAQTTLRTCQEQLAADKRAYDAAVAKEGLTASSSISNQN